MDNPFPGMNPYLEQPELWHQVHNRLIVAIADDLTPQVAPNYVVAIKERVYQSVEDAFLVGIADVSLTRRPTANPDLSTSTATAKRVVPTPVRVPLPQEVTERFLEVRSTRTGEVVCVIEVLSPKNKRDKDGRAAYESKRQKIFGSSTSLVEIDLLRVGEPMPILDTADSTYRILVSRGSDPPKAAARSGRPAADLYPFGLRDPIPPIPIPLRSPDPEAIAQCCHRRWVVDLQQLLNAVYRRARFDLAIDYTQSLKPALSAEEQAWARETLQQANLIAPELLG